MRRSDIALLSIITDGADYIFTLHKVCEGLAYYGGRKLIAFAIAHTISSLRSQSLRGQGAFTPDFPRYRPRLQVLRRLEFTVISQYLFW